MCIHQSSSMKSSENPKHATNPWEVAVQTVFQFRQSTLHARQLLFAQ
ncbi:MAG: hypothetical protein WBJ21_02965 [Burkholderiaceae bacterium]